MGLGEGEGCGTVGWADQRVSQWAADTVSAISFNQDSTACGGMNSNRIWFGAIKCTLVSTRERSISYNLCIYIQYICCGMHVLTELEKREKPKNLI